MMFKTSELSFADFTLYLLHISGEHSLPFLNSTSWKAKDIHVLRHLNKAIYEPPDNSNKTPYVADFLHSVEHCNLTLDFSNRLFFLFEVREFEIVLNSFSLFSCFSFVMAARNLYQFGNMVNCMTNRSGFSYSDYGCWCGMGGKGDPVDEVDKYVNIFWVITQRSIIRWQMEAFM